MNKILSYILFGIFAIVILSVALVLVKVTVTILVYIFIIALIMSGISYLYNRFIKNKR